MQYDLFKHTQNAIEIYVIDNQVFVGFEFALEKHLVLQLPQTAKCCKNAQP